MSYANNLENVYKLSGHYTNSTLYPRYLTEPLHVKTHFYNLNLVRQYPTVPLKHSTLLNLWLNLELGIIDEEDFYHLISPRILQKSAHGTTQINKDTYINPKPLYKRQQILRNMLIFSVIASDNNVEKIFSHVKQSARRAFVTTPKAAPTSEHPSRCYVDLYLPLNHEFPEHVVTEVIDGIKKVRIYYFRIDLGYVLQETKKHNPFYYFLDVLPLVKVSKEGVTRGDTTELTYFARKFNIFLNEDIETSWPIITGSGHGNSHGEYFERDVNRGLVNDGSTIIGNDNWPDLEYGDDKNRMIEIFRFVKVSHTEIKLIATNNNFFYTGEMTVPVVSAMDTVKIPGKDIAYKSNDIIDLKSIKEMDGISGMSNEDASLYPLILTTPPKPAFNGIKVQIYDEEWTDAYYGTSSGKELIQGKIREHPGERNPDGTIKWREIELGKTYNTPLGNYTVTSSYIQNNDLIRMLINRANQKYLIRAIRFEGTCGIYSYTLQNYPHSWSVCYFEFDKDYAGNLYTYSLGSSSAVPIEVLPTIVTIIPYGVTFSGNFIFNNRPIRNMIVFGKDGTTNSDHNKVSYADPVIDYNPPPPIHPNMSLEEMVWRFYLKHKNILLRPSPDAVPEYYRNKIIVNEVSQHSRATPAVHLPTEKLGPLFNHLSHYASGPGQNIRSWGQQYLRVNYHTSNRLENTEPAVTNFTSNCRQYFHISEHYKAAFYLVEQAYKDFIARLSFYKNDIPISEWTFLRMLVNAPAIPPSTKSVYKSEKNWSVFDQHNPGDIYYKIYM